MFLCRTPFHVGPTETMVLYIGFEGGGGFVHVDLAERKSTKKQRVVMVAKKRAPVKHPRPDSAYSKLGR